MAAAHTSHHCVLNRVIQTPPPPVLGGQPEPARNRPANVEGLMLHKSHTTMATCDGEITETLQQTGLWVYTSTELALRGLSGER